MKSFAVFILSLFIFSGLLFAVPSSDKSNSAIATDADSMEGLEMIVSRMQSLTGSLERVPEPPEMKNKTIHLPLDGEKPPGAETLIFEDRRPQSQREQKEEKQ